MEGGGGPGDPGGRAGGPLETWISFLPSPPLRLTRNGGPRRFCACASAGSAGEFSSRGRERGERERKEGSQRVGEEEGSKIPDSSGGEQFFLFLVAW